jgi:hypothetical protein
MLQHRHLRSLPRIPPPLPFLRPPPLHISLSYCCYSDVTSPNVHAPWFSSSFFTTTFIVQSPPPQTKTGKKHKIAAEHSGSSQYPFCLWCIKFGALYNYWLLVGFRMTFPFISFVKYIPPRDYTQTHLALHFFNGLRRLLLLFLW